MIDNQTAIQLFSAQDSEGSDPAAGSVSLTKGVIMPRKKTAKRKRHPKVTKAIAKVEKIQKAHRSLGLELHSVKAMIAGIPHSPQS